MTNANLSFAKIVANPTAYGWSQVYSAGKLFAVISLEKQGEETEKDYLNVLGKEVLNTLEQEFFTLETKDLESIRTAVLTTSQKIPQDINLSFVVGAAVGNVLYLYILGNGKVDIKRSQTLGTLLEAKDQANDQLKEASGFLQDGDIVILQTKAFSDEISESTLLEFLEKPSIEDAAENIAPMVHEKENPLVSSILVSFKEGEVETEAVEPIIDEEQKEDVPVESSPLPVESSHKRRRFTGLRGTRNLILLLIIAVILIFVVGVFFAVKKQESDKLAVQFNSIYPRAEKKYNEGQSLVDLNQALARDSFVEAKAILAQGKDKFPQGSKEQSQIDSLATKVDAALKDTAKASIVNAVKVDSKESFYLSTLLAQKPLAATMDDKNVYYATDTALISIANGQSTKKTLAKNSGDWKEVGGLAVYNTNIYLLEKSDNQILKFINTGSAYEQTGYFPASAKLDFANAVSLTIDNNIYVLFSDGSVKKYFKGAAVDFSIKGLDKPLKKPTKIYSNTDFDNIYILDKGNTRIVAIDKTGSFKAQYLSKVLADADDFEVLEKDKKIYVLSAGKIYKISL